MEIATLNPVRPKAPSFFHAYVRGGVLSVTLPGIHFTHFRSNCYTKSATERGTSTNQINSSQPIKTIRLFLSTASFLRSRHTRAEVALKSKTNSKVKVFSSVYLVAFGTVRHCFNVSTTRAVVTNNWIAPRWCAQPPTAPHLLHRRRRGTCKCCRYNTPLRHARAVLP
jgi:hypothetical protein